MAKKVVKEVVEQQSFSKSQLLVSNKYIDRKDALSALLNDGQQYTLAQVDKLVSDFYGESEE